MSRTGVLARAQAFAEAGMVDTCTIRRRTGETTDPQTGEITPTWSPLLYDGKCRFQHRDGRAEQADAGEAYVLLQRTEVQLPVAAIGIDVGDEITCTASRDPDLVGRAFLVHDLAYRSDATTRRLQVQERTS